MSDIFMSHPILKSFLVALIPICHHSIPNGRTITQLLDGEDRYPPSNNYLLLLERDNTEKEPDLLFRWVFHDSNYT
ncbi:hypothetical protein RhiirA5_438444 [Rhizophagus irregularis]|uniref:Uncharacterized protein n=1 Tax=Rhizophagus irregularis TaxID=588596 RepID=A0A2N0NJ49_9GLOM|nr:hypothetical protein RhiirA5_438444 [Rhizophagus irregularis]